MPFYEDLSDYVYRPGPDDPAAVNVGWLGGGREFTRGAVPDDLAGRLARLAVHHPVNRMRGWHRCPLCDTGEYPTLVDVDWQRVPVGDAEFRVPRAGGGLYAPPTLIVHYVAAHGYCPPDEFVEAVMADPRAAEIN